MHVTHTRGRTMGGGGGKLPERTPLPLPKVATFGLQLLPMGPRPYVSATRLCLADMEPQSAASYGIEGPSRHTVASLSLSAKCLRNLVGFFLDHCRGIHFRQLNTKNIDKY